MNVDKIKSTLRRMTFFYKFVFILLLIQIVNNTIIFIALNTIVNNPGIPEYRLICAVSQVLTLVLFVVFSKVSVKELGLYWHDISKKMRQLYAACCVFLLLLVASSYFVMWDIRYFALMTNINFGITTPLLEELVFRGYSWTKFKEQGFSNFNTLIITSIFFGLFHLGYYFQIAYAAQFHPEAPSMVTIMFLKVVTAIVLGFVFGVIRWKSGKVYGSIIVHSFLNILGK